jgi:hypothetical protein
MPHTVGRLIHDLGVATGVYVAFLLALGSLLSSLRGDVLDDEDEDA